MIWDQDVRVIVMLTAESEGGQLKCHPYWKGRDFGPIKLVALSEKKVSLDIDGHGHGHGRHAGTKATPASNSNVPATNGQAPDEGFSWNTNSQENVGRRRANTTTTPPQAGQQTSGSTGEAPYVIIRKFALSHAAHPFSPIREITHLHYPSWPDFGAPAQPSHLLALVELANVMQKAAAPVDVPAALASAGGAPEDGLGLGIGRHGSPEGWKRTEAHLNAFDAPEPNDHARPMLVHCSAGCGRTGAFCTVDSVIDMLKRQRLAKLNKASSRSNREQRRVARQKAYDRAKSAKRQAIERDPDGDVAMGQGVLGRLESGDQVPMFAFPPDVSASGPAFSFAGSSPPSSHPLSGFEDSGDDVSSIASSRTPSPRLPPGSDERDKGGIDTSWLDDENIDLIARTVEDFRGQRLSMVQSLRQFVLCYETVLEWIWRVQERGNSLKGGQGRLRSGSLAC